MFKFIKKIFNGNVDIKRKILANRRYANEVADGTFSKIVGYDDMRKMAMFYEENKNLFEYLKHVKYIPEIKKKTGEDNFYEFLFRGSFLEYENKKRKKILAKKINTP